MGRGRQLPGLVISLAAAAAGGGGACGCGRVEGLWLVDVVGWARTCGGGRSHAETLDEEMVDGKDEDRRGANAEGGRLRHHENWDGARLVWAAARLARAYEGGATPRGCRCALLSL